MDLDSVNRPEPSFNDLNKIRRFRRNITEALGVTVQYFKTVGLYSYSIYRAIKYRAPFGRF